MTTAAASSGHRSRQFLFKLTLILCSTILGGLLGEGVLRLAGHHGVTVVNLSDMARPVDDPVLNWRYGANSERWVGNVLYRYNSLGFRDRDHNVEGFPGVTRVGIIGDSLTDGYGVTLDDVFWAVVQRRLGQEFELITTAMGGLNTPQEIHIFEREGLRFEPELVLVNMTLNDCDSGANYEGRVAKWKRRGDSRLELLGLQAPRWIKRTLEQSALLYYMKETVHRYVGPGGSRYGGDPITGLWGRRRNRDRISSGFEHLAGLRDANHFKVLIVIFPVLVPFADYPYTKIHNWIAAQAQSQGFEVLDLLPDFANAGPQAEDLKLVGGDIFHPNPEGHAIAASAIERWISNRQAGAS